MKIEKTKLDGVLLIEPDVYRDERGFFLESFHAKKYAAHGIPELFVQDNHSRSSRGSLRGLHAQRVHPQGKLVRVLQGEIFDVAVDIRKDSPQFGQWDAAILSSDNFKQIYIPPGFLHGFCVLSEVAEVEYKCTELYRPGDEFSVLWNDTEIGIQWPVQNPILSKKDSQARPLRELMDVLPELLEVCRR